MSAAAARTIEVPEYRVSRIRLHLEAGDGQGPVIAVAALDGKVRVTTYKDAPTAVVRRAVPAAARNGRTGAARRPVDRRARSERPAGRVRSARPRRREELDGVRLTDVAQKVGLKFRQDDFALGMSNDVHGMMGGGLCWIDFNNDGRLDLFVVNSYTDANTPSGGDTAGCREARSSRTSRGRFADVSKRVARRTRRAGERLCRQRLNGDGKTDLLVTTNTYNVLLGTTATGRSRTERTPPASTASGRSAGTPAPRSPT